jgi:hypothetical protein
MIGPANRPVDERGGMDWLGPEFLTWLWWRSMTEPEMSAENGGRLYVHVDEFLELRGERAAARRTSLRAGMPSASAEGKAALRHGKVVTSARLIFARGEEETGLTLRAEDLDISAGRPPSPEGESSEERLDASLSAIRRMYADLDVCFAKFLAVRCSDAWEAEAGRMREWAAAPSQEESPSFASSSAADSELAGDGP